MRFFQLTPKLRLAWGERRQRKEAILEVTRQQGSVLPVFERVSLGVEQPLYSFDDFIAVCEK
jgi:hypothetical protein